MNWRAKLWFAHIMAALPLNSVKILRIASNSVPCVAW